MRECVFGYAYLIADWSTISNMIEVPEIFIKSSIGVSDVSSKMSKTKMAGDKRARRRTKFSVLDPSQTGAEDGTRIRARVEEEQSFRYVTEPDAQVRPANLRESWESSEGSALSESSAEVSP